MKKYIRLTLCTVISMLALSACSTVSNPSCDKSANSGTPIFNGKNLDGWEIYISKRGVDKDPNGVFRVVDGELVISGEEFGGIISKEDFENFKIVLEFKWRGDTHGKRAKKARDSGLLFASNGEYGSCFGSWINGLEVNIIEGAIGDFIHAAPTAKNDFYMISEINPQTGEYMRGGKKAEKLPAIRRIGRNPEWKDVIDAKDTNGLEKPVGEWNRLECTFKDGKVDVFLNGKHVNHLDDYFPRKGKLQIQSEGAGIVYRKIDVEKL